MENTPTARQRQRHRCTDLDRNANGNDFYLLDRENTVNWTPERHQNARFLLNSPIRWEMAVETLPLTLDEIERLQAELNALKSELPEFKSRLADIEATNKILLKNQATMLQHVENVWRLARTHVRKCQSYGPLLVSQEESDQASLDAVEQFIRTRQE